MAWIIKPMQIQDEQGEPSGKWRMCAYSDEDFDDLIYGRLECRHDSPEEARACVECDEYVSGVSGFPSRKRQLELDEEHGRAEYERLKTKYEPKG